MEKTYRKRVEIIIQKQGNVLVTINKEPTHTWYGFPGGGIESDQTLEQAAEAEALEEVKVKIDQIKVVHSLQVDGYKARASRPEIAHRESQFKGTITTYVTANCVKERVVTQASDGDEVEYVWMTPSQAIQAMNDNNKDWTGPNGRLEALKIIYHKHSLESIFTQW